MRSGVEERIPYSLSRWTDVPAAKWDWFRARIQAGSMMAIDPRNAIPYQWSLRPEDTLGLVFWTKNPSNLILDADLIKPYRFKIHVTATGWHEVERGAPQIDESATLLREAVREFGAGNVTWRFSPVPMVPDVAKRFEFLVSAAANAGLRSVYVSFLQTNDLMPETRTPDERRAVLERMDLIAGHYGLRVLLCAEDRLLGGEEYPNLGSGICAPPEDFSLPGMEKAPSEGCGCVLMADPFTVNESCTMGCEYCYAADKVYAPKKRNTTRSLPVVR